MTDKHDVVIVGAGPVGLLLGCRLAQLGISFKILEKRTKVTRHSRAIGIHPPSLELLEKLELVDLFLGQGIKVKNGQAFANTRPLGTLSFKYCPKPYDFVLTLEQHKTEKILEQKLLSLVPDALERDAEVKQLEQDNDKVLITYTQPLRKTLRADFIIACDGKDSRVRDLVGITFKGEAYPDTYLMGDFEDTTHLGSDAGIYLAREGLVESFPLPNKIRRWVVKTDSYIANASADDIVNLVQERLELNLNAATNSMLSSFGVQHYQAERFVKNRVILAGDAAHVLSPIGGQGMNLGWLDAWELAAALNEILKQDKPATKTLERYALSRKKATRTAIVRAAFNMRLGRKTRFSKLKYLLVKLMLNSPLERVFAHIFTMRWL